MSSASLHKRILYVTTVFGCGADKIDYVRVRVWTGRETRAPQATRKVGWKGGEGELGRSDRAWLFPILSIPLPWLRIEGADFFVDTGF